jgi:uncharacterized protein
MNDERGISDERMGDERGLSDELSVDQLADLIGFIARSLVDEPDQVKVETIEDDRAIILELTVAPDDLGKVIGRDGRTARAMRTLLAATSARQKRRAVLEILE